jgi:serine/threonine-protein phosphatase 2A activator
MNGSTGPVKTHDNSEMDSDRSSSKPKKFIISNTHLQAFISSATHAEVVGFIENLNNSIIGLPLDHPVLVSPVRKRKKKLNGISKCVCVCI